MAAVPISGLSGGCRATPLRISAFTTPNRANARAAQPVRVGIHRPYSTRIRYDCTLDSGRRVVTSTAVACRLDEILSGDEPGSDGVSSWDELKSMASIAYAITAGAGNYEGTARITAAEKLGPEATYEILQPTGAVQRFSEAFDGTLFNCTTVIDMHYRLLKDCMIQDDYQLVADVYAGLVQVVPPLEKELIDATADVGTQALEYFKEEHEIFVSMLEEVVAGSSDEEAIREFQQAQAIVTAVDKCTAELTKVRTAVEIMS